MDVAAHAVIAGVEKAGTTSLFRALSGHPRIAPSSVKETRYFQPILYGRELAPITEYDACFTGARADQIRLEATPRYFYGGAPLADRVCDVLGSDAAVIVVLREPVARFESFFDFQKARLRIPSDLTAADYLEHAEAMTDQDFRDPARHAWFGFRGGCYADWLPAWHEAFGARLLLTYFEDLLPEPASTLRTIATFLGIDPDAFSSYELPSENVTTGFRRAGFQRFALGINDRFERFLRRHYKVKERLRSLYYRVNGGVARRESVDATVRAELTRRYEEPNRRLAGQLRAMQQPLPSWLEVAAGV
jgi:hypothetical protein